MSKAEERTTKKFKTTNDHEVVIYDYVTGREQRAIQGIYTNEMELLQTGDGEPQITGIKGSLTEKAEDKAIELVVVSVDEKEEDVLEAVLDLPAEDYQDIVEAINEVTSPSKKEKSS